jgi:hypothetical protein
MSFRIPEVRRKFLGGSSEIGGSQHVSCTFKLGVVEECL